MEAKTGAGGDRGWLDLEGEAVLEEAVLEGSWSWQRLEVAARRWQLVMAGGGPDTWRNCQQSGLALSAKL